MTEYQVRYQNFAETRRHNKAVEQLGQQEAGIKQQEADIKEYEAATKRKALQWDMKRYSLDTLQGIGKSAAQGSRDLWQAVQHVGDQAQEAGLQAMKLLFK